MRALRSRDNLREVVESAVMKQTHECIQLLTSMRSAASMDRAVHAVRTRVKQSRALLRLLRAAMGEVRYQRAMRTLRQVNRSLAGVRDAKVMLTAYGQLQRLPDRGHSDIRQNRLRTQLAAARSQVSASARRATIPRLALAQSLVAGSPRSDVGWKAVARAIRHEYAGGHRALAAALSEPSAANLHELRKRAKTLLYLCDFLRKLSPHANSLVTPLQRIAAYLGDDRDLSLLNRAVRSAHLARRTAREQIALRKKAWKLGATVYRDAPSVFTKQIHRDWHKHR